MQLRSAQLKSAGNVLHALREASQRRVPVHDRDPSRYCADCGAILPREGRLYGKDVVTKMISGELLCLKCTKKRRTYKTRICARCHNEFPLTRSYFYPLVNYEGYAKICRLCRDKEVRRYNRRMCRRCCFSRKRPAFSDEEWNKPLGEPATCNICTNIMDKVRKKRVIQGMKYCPRCCEALSISAFYINANGSVSGYCMACTKEYNKARRLFAHEEMAAVNANRRKVAYLEAQNDQELVNGWAKGELPETPVDFKPHKLKKPPRLKQRRREAIRSLSNMLVGAKHAKTHRARYRVNCKANKAKAHRFK